MAEDGARAGLDLTDRLVRVLAGSGIARAACAPAEAAGQSVEAGRSGAGGRLGQEGAGAGLPDGAGDSPAGSGLSAGGAGQGSGAVPAGAGLPDGASVRREREAAFDQRGQAGDFGAMEYMRRYAGKHYHTRVSLPWCNSLLMVAVPVWQDLPAGLQARREDPAWGLVARYAWGRDYHKVVGKVLQDLCRRLDAVFPGEQWKPWVDAHPLDEVFFAQASGLGFRGRHGLCIAGDLGTWFALGVVATTLVIPAGLVFAAGGPASGPGAPAAAVVAPGRAEGIPAEAGPGPEAPAGTGQTAGCGTHSGTAGPPAADSHQRQPPAAPRGCPPGCRACVRACPTGAIIDSPQGWRIEPTRCISYLTMELKADIPPDLRPAMGRRIFGCDTCQEACPLARRALRATQPDFLSHKAGPALELAEVLGLPPDRDAFVARFGGSPVVRAGRDALVRNACVAAANAGQTGLVPLLEQLVRQEPDGMVGRHARWALDQLAGPDAGGPAAAVADWKEVGDD